MCRPASSPFKSVASICFGAAVVLVLADPLSAQTDPAPLYTAAQAEAGEKAFEASCARCHNPDLRGKDDAPPLVGLYFASSWGGHKVAELLGFVAGNMPMDAPGTLDATTYAEAVAYILSKNGVPAGSAPLAKGAVGVITVPAPAVVQQAARVSVSFAGTAMHDVLAFFAQYAGRSIVAGSGVAGVVSAEIHDQRWDLALDALLTAHGLSARELESGIILVEGAGATAAAPGRLVTRTFRLNFVPAQELQAVVQSMLSPRGSVAVLASVNALVVTDEERVLGQVARILNG